jgi:putative oxidoreductase
VKKTASFLSLLGRILLCSLFIWAGCAKLSSPAATAQYFLASNVPAPGLMVWIAIAIELGGGFCLLLGFKARWAGAVLALWSLATGVAVHLSAGLHSANAGLAYDNMIHFYKNLGLAGGMLYLMAFGAGAFSIDNMVDRRSNRECASRPSA